MALGRALLGLILVLLCSSFGVAPALRAQAIATARVPFEVGSPAQAKIAAAYGKLPLTFEANRGQVDSSVQFVSRGQGYMLFLTSREAVLSLRQAGAKRDVAFTPGVQQRGTEGGAPAVVRMQLVGGNRKPQAVGEDELPGKSNYFMGNDPAQWRTSVPQYAKVRYREVYSGIDLIYYGNQRRLEHDFVVAPGADPGRIRLRLRGVHKLRLDAGDLVMRTSGGELRLVKPVIYQVVEGRRREVAGGYVLKGSNQAGFEVAGFDHHQPLVIDPVLSYSTYLGGNNGDWGTGIAVDSSGNVYVTGYTSSTNFPVNSAYQSSLPNNSGGTSVFVTKLAANGQSLVYSTYLGGSYAGGLYNDQGQSIAVDSSGNAYITGYTKSLNFPTTSGAYFPYSPSGLEGCSSAFVAKLAANGQSLVYSTYLGGYDEDQGQSIAVDSSGNAYVTGTAQSTNFPTTPGAYQTRKPNSDGASPFVTKLDPNGRTLVYSTYLGGNNDDETKSIAVDASGHAYVTGTTSSENFPTTPGAYQTSKPAGGVPAFVTKLDPYGQTLVYSTYLGGNSQDQGQSIAVDSNGNAYVTGYTSSPNFPTTARAYQTSPPNGSTAFVTKLAANGQTLVYSTYLGGNTTDGGYGIAVDSSGNACITGSTSSTNFPTTTGAYQTSPPNGSTSGFVTKLAANGQSLVYSTYLGGNVSEAGSGIALDSSGNIYITGTTSSTNFPTTSGAFQSAMGGGNDAFVAKFNLASSTGYTLTVIDAGSGRGGVTSLPAGINCGSNCSANYSSGTSVTLTATPASGSTFSGWSGACSGTGTCPLFMNANQNVTATFDCTLCLPRVLTSPMRATGATSATLEGIVNPGGVATTYWFEYSTREAQFTNTHSQALSASTTESTVTTALNGLEPHTAYYFRLAARNSAGTSQGQILEFHTGSSVPSVGSKSTAVAGSPSGTAPAPDAANSMSVAVKNTNPTTTYAVGSQTVMVKVAPGGSPPLVLNLRGAQAGAPVTANCADLPEDIECRYDENNQTLTITSGVTTPPGNYPIYVQIGTAP
jgi:hypothetical protein